MALENANELDSIGLDKLTRDENVEFFELQFNLDKELLEDFLLSGLGLTNDIIFKSHFVGTNFKNSGLKGTSFRNAVFRNVSFKTDAKKAIFDGAVMDKLTYAVLKGNNANLTNVTVI